MNMKASNTNQAPKNFKKKAPSIPIDVPKSAEKNNDKFIDLRTKLEREKESMRKTGRRFKEDFSVSTEMPSKEMISEKVIEKESSSKSHEVCVGPDEIVKEHISLCEISGVEEENNESMMRSSRVFEREVRQQKKKNSEIQGFLRKLGLEQFSEGLLNNGYDDLETLAEVTVEDLNLVMMRAKQQDKLIHALKTLNLRDSQIGQEMNRSSVSTSTGWRMKTEAQPTLSARLNTQPSARLKTETVDILEKLKLKEKKGSQQLVGSSFLYTVGSRNWGVEDQIRRACSSCFRVEKQMEMKGDCYYCSNCYKIVSEDLLTISLDTKMSRSYLQKDK